MMKKLQVSREQVKEMAELAIEKAELPEADAEKIRAVVAREDRLLAFAFSATALDSGGDYPVKCPACAAGPRLTVNAIRNMSETMARFTKHWDNVVTLEAGRSYKHGLVIEIID